MSLSVIEENESEKIEEAGKIASLMIGEEEYNHIRSNGGELQRDYEDVEDVELIELAISVVNGEYPEMDERFSYGSGELTAEDFVQLA
jgi:hypothetical protein